MVKGLATKNENIYSFIIKEAYERNRVKHVFNTNACAIEEIFGTNQQSS
jgi:hypothetical protein